LSRATLYRRIAEGKFPAPPLTSGDGRAVGHQQRCKPGLTIQQAIRSRCPIPMR